MIAHDHRVAGAVAHPGSHRTQRADFPHCARQKLTHSTAIACSSAYKGDTALVAIADSGALPFEGLSPLPQRSSLRSGFCCPSPSTLIRPHPRHSRAHPDFAILWFIWDAFAVLVRLGDLRVVPCFRSIFLLDMPSSTTPGSPSVAHAQFLHRRRWPSPSLERLGTPKSPIIRFRWDVIFEASLVRCLLQHSLRPADLLALLADLTGYFSQPTGAFTSGLSTGRSPFPPPDITTVATEQVPPLDYHPLEHQLASLHLNLQRMKLSFTTPCRFNRRTEKS